MRLPAPLSLIAATAAGICWAAALTLLLFGGLSAEGWLLAPQRLIYYAVAIGAALFTFGPLERQLGLAGLTVEGTIGVSLLLYTLAFVPAPTDWLLALPDLPVYTLLIAALFLTGSALARPFVFVITRRLYRQRARALDMRRVRRQSYEVGLLLATGIGLAGLRVLTWVSLLLLFLALLIAELLFLARVRVEEG